jgi:segregation and condensation protein A
MTTTRPLQDDYHVSLESFKGPVDLLIFLIRRAEVDITDIPIAEITDQYLAFLGQIESIDIDLAGEFLVMAATLVEIKSRVLQRQRELKAAGQSADAADAALDLNLDAADPRYELVQQLLAYQRYRVAAEDLDHRRVEFSRRFPAQGGSRLEPKPLDSFESADDDGPTDLELDDAHLFDLVEAYQRILESVDFSKLGAHEVEYDDTPIGLHQEDLVDRLSRAPGKRITLQEAWLGRRRADIIGLFLATLELVKQRRVLVVQDDIHGEIMLELNRDPDIQSPVPPASDE